MAHDECAFDNLDELMGALDRAGFTFEDTTWANDEVPSLGVTFNSPDKRDYVDYQIYVPDCHDFKGYMVVDFHGSPVFENASIPKLLRWLGDTQDDWNDRYR